MSPDAMEEVNEEEGDPEGKAAKPGNKQDESNRRASGAEPRRTPVMVVNEAAPMRPGSRGQVRSCVNGMIPPDGFRIKS